MDKVASLVGKSKEFVGNSTKFVGKSTKFVGKYINLTKVKEWLGNPYVAGVIGILAVAYGGLMAPKLPQSIAKWFANPVFKMIFIFMILFAHKINPVLSIVLALAFIISIQTMIRYQVVDMVQFEKNPIYQKPSVAEVAQIKQEMSDDMVQRQMEQSDPVEQQEPVQDPSVGLHPINRPTLETLYKDNRVEDPDDPRQPAIQMMNDPNLNVAIYELNPPYANKMLPIGDEGGKLNVSGIHVPKGGPTRYSAYHGYSIA